MLEKQIFIIKKKKKIYKKKYIGIILLYHFSPSLLKRIKDSKTKKIQVDIKTKTICSYECCKSSDDYICWC